MVEISVIIPVYNLGVFLGECLDSISNQTFKDIEIICVSDGLSDDALKILKKNVSHDKRFNVIDRKTGGHAAATNLGIDISKGKYLFLMDCDDILDLDALENTYKLAEAKNADFIMSKSTVELVEAGDSWDALTHSVGKSVFCWSDIKEFIFSLTGSKLFSREFIVKKNIRFKEGLVFDNILFFFDVLFAAKRITCYDNHLFKKQKLYRSSDFLNGPRLFDCIPVSNLIWHIFRKYGVFEEFKEKLFEEKIRIVAHGYNEINEEFSQEYFDRMKSDFIRLAGDKEFFDDFSNTLAQEDKMFLDAVIESEVYSEFDLRLRQKQLINTIEFKTKIYQELRTDELEKYY